jgi:hypothetical protein
VPSHLRLVEGLKFSLPKYEDESARFVSLLPDATEEIVAGRDEESKAVGLLQLSDTSCLR